MSANMEQHAAFEDKAAASLVRIFTPKESTTLFVWIASDSVQVSKVRGALRRSGEVGSQIMSQMNSALRSIGPAREGEAESKANGSPACVPALVAGSLYSAALTNRIPTDRCEQLQTMSVKR